MVSSNQDLIAAFNDSVSSRNYEGATEVGALIELAVEDTEGFFPDVTSAAAFFSDYMVSFLIINELNGARHLWRRAPQAIKVELAPLWNVGKLLWEQDIVKVRGALEHQWPQRLAPLIDILRSTIISRGIQEVTKAYSVISITKLQDVMMKNHDETIEECTRLGWVVDEDNLYVYPRANINEIETRSAVPIAGDDDLIQKLSEYVAHFEKKALKVDLNSSGAALVISGSSVIASSSSNSAIGLGSAPKKTGTK